MPHATPVRAEVFRDIWLQALSLRSKRLLHACPGSLFPAELSVFRPLSLQATPRYCQPAVGRVFVLIASAALPFLSCSKPREHPACPPAYQCDRPLRPSCVRFPPPSAACSIRRADRPPCFAA